MLRLIRNIVKKPGKKNLKKKNKKVVDKNNVVMYNHHCVTPNDVTEYW